MTAIDQRPSADLPARLAAPILVTNEPFVRPGEQLCVSLPLRAAHGTAGNDLVVRFFAESGECQPSFVRFPALSPGAEIVATTTATVNPSEGKLSLEVWADVRVGDADPIRSATARLPIQVRSKLALNAIDTGNHTAIAVENDGTGPALARLELYGGPNLDAGGLVLIEDRPGRIVSDPFSVAVGERLELFVSGGPIDHVIVSAEDGERASTTPERHPPASPGSLSGELHVSAAAEGVRAGDTIVVTLPLANPGDVPLESLSALLAPVPGADLLWHSITVDESRLIAADLSETPDGALLRLGRLSPGARSVLRFSYRATFEDPRTLDALHLLVVARAANVPELELEADAPVDHRPMFAPSATYLDEILETEHGYAVDAVITNAESRALERLRIRFDLADAVPSDTVTLVHGTEERSIPLRPTALHEQAGLFADLGGLDPNDRITVRLGLAPARSLEDHRILRVRAILLADDAVLPIGEASRRVTGCVDLRESGVRRTDDRPLRLGMPVEVTLDVRNTGDSPAHDVRLALDLPAHVGASLPDAPRGGRWRPFAKMLPPGGAVTTTVTFFLIEAPGADTVEIPLHLDAQGQSAFEIGRLVFSTPTSPLVDPPRLQSEARDDGHIHFLARIANHGDGTAQAVAIRVKDDRQILARSTAVDGVSLVDHGPRSPLATRLPLGDLPPGAYRDVTWIVAIADDVPYRTTVEVTSANGPAVSATSIPRRARRRLQIDDALPKPRRMGESENLADGRRSVRIVTDDEAIAKGPDVAALASADHAAVPTVGIGLPHHVPPPESIAWPSGLPSRELALLAEGSCMGDVARVDEARPAEPARDERIDVLPASDQGAGSIDDDVLDDLIELPAAPATPGTPMSALSQSASPRRLASSLVDIASGLAMASSMLEVPALGWWRHIIAIRSLMPVTLALDDDAEQLWKIARPLLREPCKKVYPKTYQDAFFPDDPFVDHLGANDTEVLGLLDQIERIAHLPFYYGAAAGLSKLDAILPTLVPDTVGNAEVDAALGHYKDTAARVFTYPSMLEMNVLARREKFAKTNATLDVSLENLVKAHETVTRRGLSSP